MDAPLLKKKVSFSGVLIELGLLIGSALLFALSFPSPVSHHGLFPLAFIAFFPVFIVIRRSGWVRVCLYGLFYGWLSYSLFNYWLLKFHPLAIFIVPTIYAVFILVLFPVLKLADLHLKEWAFIPQLFIWLAYEFLKTKGFLGYSYGVIGYTQYSFLPLARVSALTGVWGVSFLVLFPSLFIGHALKSGFRGFTAAVRKHRYILMGYAVLCAAALVYGGFSKVDYTDAPKWKVGLVQHNVDPWKHDYEDALNILIRLSREAVRENPDAVIWSETAFVPAIEYHTRHRQNQKAYLLVKRLLAYLESQDVPFIIGNDDGQLERVGNKGRVDYNAVLLMEKGEITQKYWKTHLVPFTEYFPFPKTFPRLYNWLVEWDTHFWEKGTEYTVFRVDDVSFSTPICFEDTFGYLSRRFVREGAEVIVNLTNDSWSFSTPAMVQHMAMSVFRGLENRRSVVRATNGGLTCIIDPNGRITHRIDTFEENYLVGEVPVYAESTTLYTRWGDWFGYFSLAAALAFLAFGVIRRLVKKNGDNGIETD